MCTHTHLHPLKKNTPKCQQKISLCDEIEWPLCYYFCISVFSEVFIVTMASLALKVHTWTRRDHMGRGFVTTTKGGCFILPFFFLISCEWHKCISVFCHHQSRTLFAPKGPIGWNVEGIRASQNQDFWSSRLDLLSVSYCLFLLDAPRAKSGAFGVVPKDFWAFYSISLNKWDS